MVPDDEPYALRLEGDHERVCITQATLGDRTRVFWSNACACSKLKCAVGTKPPVYICALSKEKPFTRLNLAFEKSQEVVFSIRGPQGIHLTGYYAPPAGEKDKSTSTDDLPVDCALEGKNVVEENEDPEKLTAEEDVGYTNSLPDGDKHNLGKKDQLVDAEMHEDVNEKIAEEQQEIVCAFDTELQDGGDEEYVLCIRKISTTGNSKLDKVGKDAEKVTVEPDGMVENTGTVDNKIEENTDAIREASLPSDLLLPPKGMDLDKGTEPGKISSEHFIKENASESSTYATAIEDDEVEQEDSNKNCLLTMMTEVGEAKEQALTSEQENKGMHGGEGNIDKVDVDCHVHVLGEVEEQKAHSESDALHQDCSRNQEVEMPSIASRSNSNEASEEENLDNNLVDSETKVNVSHAKVEEQKPSSEKEIGDAYPGEGSYRDSLKEDKVRQDVKGNENMLIIMPKNAGDRKAIDERAAEEQVQQKKQKTEACKIENNVCVIPCKTRTLSNGMIIEDVNIGKCYGKKAAPGRKVKIFYTARLRDTGALVDTNVGENPLKFCLDKQRTKSLPVSSCAVLLNLLTTLQAFFPLKSGDKRIIPGLSIGIDGMHIEGRRRLLIPPAIGYGEKVKAHLPPNAWLVYDVELVGVKICRRRCGQS